MKPCKICGQPFTSPRKANTVCSPACRKENRSRNSARGRARLRAARANTPKAPQARAQGIVEAHRCIACGEPCRRYECAPCFRLTKWRVAAGIIGAVYAMRKRGQSENTKPEPGQRPAALY